MTAMLRAEWTKLRTLRGTWWSVLAIVVLAVGLTALVCSIGQTDASAVGEGDDDVVQNGLVGIFVAQVVVVTLAVSAITSEFGTRMIQVTLAAEPRRWRVLAAKAAVLASVVFIVGLASSITAFGVSQPLLRDGGYVAPAYPPVSLGDGPAARAVAGTALLLTAFALLGFGIGAIVRRTAAGVAITVGLILLPLIMAPLLPADLRRLIWSSAPAAGFSIQSTTGRAFPLFAAGGPEPAPISPWAGLAVSFAWAAVAMGIAWWLFRRRDI